jgi:hypothetical protein
MAGRTVGDPSDVFTASDEIRLGIGPCGNGRESEQRRYDCKNVSQLSYSVHDA